MQNGGKRYGQKEVLSIAPECCHPSHLKLRFVKARSGSTPEQSIIVSRGRLVAITGDLFRDDFLAEATSDAEMATSLESSSDRLSFEVEDFSARQHHQFSDLHFSSFPEFRRCVAWNSLRRGI